MHGRQERLIRKAGKYLTKGERIPLDLAAAMLDAGLDVYAIEVLGRQNSSR